MPTGEAQYVSPYEQQRRERLGIDKCIRCGDPVESSGLCMAHYLEWVKERCGGIKACARLLGASNACPPHG